MTEADKEKSVLELWLVCAVGEDKGENVLNVPYPVWLDAEV